MSRTSKNIKNQAPDTSYGLTLKETILIGQEVTKKKSWGSQRDTLGNGLLLDNTSDILPGC